MNDNNKEDGTSAEILKWFPGIGFILVVVLFSSLWFSPRIVTGDSGTLRLLASGRWQWDQGMIAVKDMLSFYYPGETWIRFDWLSELLGWGVYRSGGAGALSAAAMTLFVIAIFILWRLLIRRVSVWPLALAYVFGATLLLYGHQYARPVLFTYLFLSILVWMRECQPRNFTVKMGLVWVTLFTLWANLHAGFFAGFLFLGLSLMGELVDRWKTSGRIDFKKEIRPWIAMAVAFLCTGFNPSGFNLHTHILETMTRIKSVGLLRESQPLSLRGDPVLVFGLVVIVLSLWLMPEVRRRLRWQHGLPAAVFVLFSFLAVRHLFLLVIVAALPVTLAWQRFVGQFLSDKRRHRILNFSKIQSGNLGDYIFVPLAIALLTWQYMSNPAVSKISIGDNFLDAKAREYINHSVESFQCPLSNDATANALLYFYHPKIKISMDDRMDYYGDEVAFRHRRLLLVESGWEEVLDNGNFDSAIFSKESRGLAQCLDIVPGWSKVLETNTSIIYLKKK